MSVIRAKAAVLLLILGAILLSLTPACASRAGGGQPQIVGVPVRMEVSAYPMPYTVEDAAKRASQIAIGKVSMVEAARWNTPDGQRPPNLRVDASGYVRIPVLKSQGAVPGIYTPVVISIEKGLKGVGQEKQLKVSFTGGTVGADSIVAADEPIPAGGQTVVFFGQRPTAEPNGDVLDVPLAVYLVSGDQAKASFGGMGQLPLADLERRVLAATGSTSTPQPTSTPE
jgi:hypothetical protein